MKNGQSTRKIFEGLKTSLFYSLIIALLLLLVVLVYSIIVRKNLIQGIFTTLISVLLLLYAFAIENIYFYMGG